MLQGDIKHIGGRCCLTDDVQFNIFNGSEIIPEGVDLVHYHGQTMMMFVLIQANVIAPDFQIAFGDTGIGSDHKQNSLGSG